MSDDDQRRGLSRRQLLILSAAGGVSAMGVGSGLDADGEDGTLYGGKMALSQAFNVAGDLWVGPDSAKSGVSADSGRMYFASDTQLTYYGDGGSWVSLGIGTSGNKAPASYFQSSTIDDLDTRTQAASYFVYTDGTNIVAEPQQNPVGPSMDEVTGTDIGVVLDDVIINQLPPQGDTREMEGRIHLRRGRYPGDLANGTVDGIPVNQGLFLIGESVNHIIDTGPTSSIPFTLPGVRFDTTSRGIATQGDGTEEAAYNYIQNIQITGPGNADNGSVGLWSPSGSDNWDLTIFDNVVIDFFDQAFDINTKGMMMFKNFCVFREWFGQSKFVGDRIYVRDSFLGVDDDAQITLDRAKVHQSFLHGTGETRESFFMNDEARITECRLTKQTSGTTGALIKMAGGNNLGDPAPCVLNCWTGTDAGGTFNNIVTIDDAPGAEVRGIRDHGLSTSVTVIANGNSAQAIIEEGRPSAGVTDMGTNNMVNGAVTGSYTGDGGSGANAQEFVVGFRPGIVVIEDSSGTLYEANDFSGITALYGSVPGTGSITITDNSFKVDDGGADADPNTNTESYNYYVLPDGTAA